MKWSWSLASSRIQLTLNILNGRFTTMENLASVDRVHLSFAPFQPRQIPTRGRTRQETPLPGQRGDAKMLPLPGKGRRDARAFPVVLHQVRSRPGGAARPAPAQADRHWRLRGRYVAPIQRGKPRRARADSSGHAQYQRAGRWSDHGVPQRVRGQGLERQNRDLERICTVSHGYHFVFFSELEK